MQMTMQQEPTDMQTIEGRIVGIERKLDTLNTSVLMLQGSIMQRSEVYAEDAKRVSTERFDGEMAGVRDRLIRLESGPQKMLAWVGIGTGCLSVIIAAVAVLATMLIAIVPHLH